MGQAKLKTAPPANYAGPRGDKYYCRNRCGAVVHYKGTNETFIERTSRPLWGWCESCSRAVIDAVKDGMPDPMFARALTPAEVQIRKDLAAFNALSPEAQDATMLP